MVVIPNGLEIFNRHNTRDSENDMKLQYKVYSKVWYNLY